MKPSLCFILLNSHLLSRRLAASYLREARRRALLGTPLRRIRRALEQARHQKEWAAAQFRRWLRECRA